MFREPAGAREVADKSGKSFDLERCKAAYDGRASRVPRYQHGMSNFCPDVRRSLSGESGASSDRPACSPKRSTPPHRSEPPRRAAQSRQHPAAVPSGPRSVTRPPCGGLADEAINHRAATNRAPGGPRGPAPRAPHRPSHAPSRPPILAPIHAHGLGSAGSERRARAP